MATASKSDPRKGNNEPPFKPGAGSAPKGGKANTGKASASTGNNSGKAGAPPKGQAANKAQRRAGGKNSAAGSTRPNTRKR